MAYPVHDTVCRPSRVVMDAGTSEGARKAWQSRNRDYGNVEIAEKPHYTTEHTVSSPSGPKTVKAQAFNVYHNGQHVGHVATHTHNEQKGGRHGGGGARGYSTGRTLLRWSANAKEGGPSRHGLRSRDDAIEHLLPIPSLQRRS